MKWVTKQTLDERVADEIIGFRNGFSGIVNQDYETLTRKNVRRWDRDGGTNLGSSGRYNVFDDKGVDRSSEFVSNLSKMDIGALIITGGDGSLRQAYKLSQLGVPIIGIPKTIDLGIPGTSYTLGFLSAVDENLEVMDKLRNTAGSHETITIMETMGRELGHLAIYSGKVGHAGIILIPEYGFRIDDVVQRLIDRSKFARYDILVVAEGALPYRVSRKEVDEVGGIGKYLEKKLKEMTQREVRYTNSGYLQRGAWPHAFDKLWALNMAIHAVNLTKERRDGLMVCRQNGVLTEIPLKYINDTPNTKIDIETQYDPKKLLSSRNPKAFGNF